MHSPTVVLCVCILLALGTPTMADDACRTYTLTMFDSFGDYWTDDTRMEITSNSSGVTDYYSFNVSSCDSNCTGYDSDEQQRTISLCLPCESCYTAGVVWDDEFYSDSDEIEDDEFYSDSDEINPTAYFVEMSWQISAGQPADNTGAMIAAASELGQVDFCVECGSTCLAGQQPNSGERRWGGAERPPNALFVSPCSHCPPQPSDGCESCPSGTFRPNSYNNSPCIKCPEGTFFSGVGATECTSCPAVSPLSSHMSTSTDDCYSTDSCQEVTVEGCAGAGLDLSGVYTPFAGFCGNTGGNPAYYCNETKKFLFYNLWFIPEGVPWTIGSTCGETDPDHGAIAWGMASDEPFISTSPTWQCTQGNNWRWMGMSITCTNSPDLPPCNRGTFNASGVGPNGECFKCPPRLEWSKRGATSVDDCFTIKANVMIASEFADRVVVTNTDSNAYELLNDADGIAYPYGLVLVTDDVIAVSNYYENSVSLLNAAGDHLNTAIHIGDPGRMLLLPHLGLLAVTGWLMTWPDDGWGIHFFYSADIAAGKELSAEDAVSSLLLEDFGMFDDGDIAVSLVLGENDDEVLITTENEENVFRLCIPNLACKQDRNRKMLEYADYNPNNQGFREVVAVPSEGVYFVTSREEMTMYKCSLSVRPSIAHADCLEFYLPGGDWDPSAVTYDAKKGVLYVGDFSKAHVYAFDRDGDYLGTLEDRAGYMNGVTAMEFRPGPFAYLSPISAPVSAVAGVPISNPYSLHDRYNAPTAPLPSTTLQITASGTITLGSEQIGSTLTGTISPTHADINIRSAGNWTIAITEGKKNVQNLYGSPYVITVDPGPTDPASTTAAFPTSITAGGTFTASLTPHDAYDNPTAHPDDSFTPALYLLDASLPDLPPFNSAFSFSTLLTTAGAYRLVPTHVPSSSPLNPLHFIVRPDALSISNSDHNLLSVFTFDPSSALPLTLSVSPRDQFYNDILDATHPDATSMSVKVDNDVYELLPPKYEKQLTFPPDTDLSLSITFLHGDLPIAPEQTMTVAQAGISQTDVYTIMFALMVGGVFIFVLYTKLSKKNEHGANMVMKEKEIKKAWMSIAINSADPISDMFNWFLVMRHCAMFGSIYLILVVVSFIAAFVTLLTSVRQLFQLKSDVSTLTLNTNDADLDGELPLLRAKYEAEVGRENSSFFKKTRSKLGAAVVAPVDVVAEEDPILREREQRLLRQLKLILTCKTVILRKKRKQERVVSAVMQVREARTSPHTCHTRAALATHMTHTCHTHATHMPHTCHTHVCCENGGGLQLALPLSLLPPQSPPHAALTLASLLQVLVEDFPVTMCNAVFLVIGCGGGAAAATQGECSSARPGAIAMFFFLGTTMFTLTWAAKKLYEWQGLKELRWHMQNLEEIVLLRTIEAKEVYRQVVVCRGRKKLRAAVHKAVTVDKGAWEELGGEERGVGAVKVAAEEELGEEDCAMAADGLVEVTAKNTSLRLRLTAATKKADELELVKTGLGLRLKEAEKEKRGGRKSSIFG